MNLSTFTIFHCILRMINFNPIILFLSIFISIDWRNSNSFLSSFFQVDIRQMYAISDFYILLLVTFTAITSSSECECIWSQLVFFLTKQVSFHMSKILRLSLPLRIKIFRPVTIYFIAKIWIYSLIIFILLFEFIVSFIFYNFNWT